MNGYVKTFCKPHHRMDATFHYLKVLDDKNREKRAEVDLELRNIHKSQAQTDLRLCHPDEAMVALYNLVQRDENIYFIHRHNNIDEGYKLTLNPRTVCNREQCLVKCKKCNDAMCVHIWVCECYAFCYSNVCKHIHMLYAHLKEIDGNNHSNPHQGSSNDLVSEAPQALNLNHAVLDNTDHVEVDNHNFDQNYTGINNNNDLDMNGQPINVESCSTCGCGQHYSNVIWI